MELLSYINWSSVCYKYCVIASPVCIMALLLYRSRFSLLFCSFLVSSFPMHVHLMALRFLSGVWTIFRIVSSPLRSVLPFIRIPSASN